MTAREVVLLRRAGKVARILGIVVAVVVVLDAVVVAADGDWITAVVALGVAVVVVLNFAVYAPWIFERIIRKRGSLMDSPRMRERC